MINIIFFCKTIVEDEYNYAKVKRINYINKRRVKHFKKIIEIHIN